MRGCECFYVYAGGRRNSGSRGSGHGVSLLMPLITAIPPTAGGMGGTKTPMSPDPFKLLLRGMEEDSRSNICRCRGSGSQRCGRRTQPTPHRG
ncbi:hypothetical protein AMECASPLE_033336 [Ameca splendens]|uniref:Uncharacterized protein n=1 Tax=Ameca splendens TaxID=208324 RepID=A0ABV0YIZ9_9TELE